MTCSMLRLWIVASCSDMVLVDLGREEMAMDAAALVVVVAVVAVVVEAAEEALL